MLKGLGNIAEMAKMMSAAKEMQARMASLQDDLSRMTLTGESGGGLVLVHCTGKGNITGIDLNPAILHPSAKEQAEQLILAALQDAQSRAQNLAKSELAKIAQSLGLPADLPLI